MQQGNSRSMSDADYDRNNLGTEQGLSRVAYSVWVPAIEWDGEAPATYITPADTDPGYWLMEGATGAEPDRNSMVYYYMRRPIYWNRGHIEPRIHYSHNLNSKLLSLKFGWKFVARNAAFGATTVKATNVTTGNANTLNILVPKDALDTSFATAAFATDVINPFPAGQYGVAGAEPNVPPTYEGLYFMFGHDTTNDSAHIDVKFYGAELIFYQHDAAAEGAFYGDFFLGDTML